MSQRPIPLHIGPCSVFMDMKHLVIKPHESVTEIMIDRSSLEIGSLPSTNLKMDIYLGDIKGIVGVKHLVKRSYLIGIQSSTCVSRRYKTYKINSVSMFPIQDIKHHRDESYRDQLEWKWEETYLEMLSTLFKTCNFYYSLHYDLTNSVQRNADISSEWSRKERLHDYYNFSDPRFQWNYNLLQMFDPNDTTLCRFRLPIIMGFVTEKSIDNQDLYRWLLISRRSTRRAGTRYNRRGIDEHGNVANFVETEQILLTPNGESSFLQIRGSIPLYWGQTPDVRFKPAIDIYPRDHDSAIVKHFEDLKSYYGDVSIASLIDETGHEAQLCHELGRRIESVKDKLKINYHSFDFHKECSKMRWHRLNILLKDLIPEISKHGVYMLIKTHGSTTVSRQNGIIRSNCIDSLDRTNVVQSMIARHVLESQLNELERVSLSDFLAFDQVFKNAWADNADALSVQYAGTPALKTDFTRTGKRTYSGLFNDAYNSATRYVLNNYLDNYRQDSFDLLLGNFTGYPSPTYKPLVLATYSSTFPVAIIALTLVALYIYFRFDAINAH